MRVFSRYLSNSRVFKQYDHWMAKRPLLTQMVTAGTLCAVGDIVAQQAFEGRRVHDYYRTLRMASFGFLYWAPICSKWMVVAERLFPGTAASQLFKKIICDQILFTPVILSCFLMINAALSGQGLSGGLNKLKVDFGSMLVANWSVWIPAQLLNFYFMPLNYRVVFIQVVALFWNMYVSWKANRQI